MKVILALSLCFIFAWGASLPAQDSALPGHLDTRTDSLGLRKACGPLSLYAALKSAGYNVSLPEIAKQAKHDGQVGVIIQDLVSTAENLSSGMARGVNTSPSQLITHLNTGGTAVLFVRRSGQQSDHALCVLGSHSIDTVTEVRILDYPTPLTTLPLEVLLRKWDGDAILVSSQAVAVPHRVRYILELLLVGQFTILATLGIKYLFKSHSKAVP